MKCPHCGYETDDYSMATACALCSGFAVGTGTGIAGYFGKERAAKRGRASFSSGEPLQSYLKTLYDSFARPDVFFAVFCARASKKQALIYGLVMGSIGTLLAYAMSAILPPSFSTLFGGNGLFRHATRSTPAILILTPFILIFQYYLSASYIQSMLKISGSRPKPFAITFKALCYAGGAQIFEWVPVIGPFLTFIAWMYLAIAGLHTVHGISRFRAAMALVLPMVLLFVLLAFIVIIGIAALTMVGGSVPDFLKFLHL